jgi:aryl-alcohol dehydrogenase-like predicted oxidoreductase
VALDPQTFPDEFRRNMPRFNAENYPRNMVYIERFKTYAKERGVNPATLANAWVLHRAPHILPIPGTRTAEHLAENAAASNIVLTAADMAEIETILPAGFAHGNRYSTEQQGASELYG